MATRMPAQARLFMTTLALSALVAPAALATQPASWSFVDGKDFEKGDLDGLTAHPTEGLATAPGLQRLAVEAELIHCWVRDGGKLWLGTGLEAKLFVVDAGKVKEFAKLPGAVVGALAPDGKGGVYASVLGSEQLLRVDSAGKVETVVALPEVKHIWALLPRGNTLLAATGPGGKVFQVDPSAKSAKLFANTDTEHALTLLADGNSVLVGTAGSPMVLRLDSAGKATAIASFPGAEVRSLARHGDRIYAAVNGSAEVAKLATLKPTPNRPGSEGGEEGGKASKKGGGGGGGGGGAEGGAGAIWARHDDGQLYQVFGAPAGVIGQIAVFDAGAGPQIAVGGGRKGRVSLGDGRGSVETLFDLDEGAVLGIEAGPKGITTLLTGKSAAVYTVSGAASRSAFTSEVLAESGVARWGRVEATGSGNLTIESRSGYSNPVNDTWSPWQPLAGERVQSPPATMLQVRVTLSGPGARLRELRVHRRLLNRAPVLEKVEVKPAEDAKGSLRATWAARDPDGDKLAYVATYRKRGSSQWLMLHDRTIDKNQLTLSPNDMPDGWYELQVEVSDSPQNARSEARGTSLISGPFLVDQGRPDVVAALEGTRLSGIATDATSAIVKVEVSFDGEPAQLCAAGDGIFDGMREAFEIALPPGLKPGRHTALVMATDAAGVIGVVSVAFSN